MHQSPLPFVISRCTRPCLHKIFDLEFDDGNSPPRRLLSPRATADPDFEVVFSAKAAHIAVDDTSERERDKEYNADDGISHEFEPSGTEEPALQAEYLDRALEPNVSGKSTKN